MTLPTDLQRPGVRWDNIRPVPVDVRAAGQAMERDKAGNLRPVLALPHEQRIHKLTEVWWLVPRYGRGE